MSIERHIGRLAGVLVALHAGQLCGAAAQELSFAGGALQVDANTSGIGVHGDVRASLGAMTGDSDAEWLSRVRGGYDYHSDGDSRFWAETIQPLVQSESATAFWQARLSHAHDDQTLNAGLGYRWLPSERLMLGVNAFYDYAFDAGHQRVSLGAEALGSYFTFRTNIYQGASGWRPIGGGVREQALSGADASLDTQAPYMPWLRIGARYYEWNGINASDAQGLQGTISADISDVVQFVGTYAGDDDPEGDYYVGLRVRMASSGERPTAMRQFWSPVLLEARDVSAHRLDFVERENRIITESQGGAFASGTITVSRGD